VGTGLGLAISRKIAAELGGALEVERDGRLGGAVFRLTLPAQASAIGAEREPRVALAKTRARTAKAAQEPASCN
jgi:hypothetical protein